MKVAILGAGAVALSSACLLKDSGHEVSLWSAFEGEIDALNAAGGVTCEGALEGVFAVDATNDITRALDGAGVVMIAAPAFGHPAIMDAAAPHIADGQTIVMHSATAMSSLILARSLADRGVRPTFVDLGTSVCTSRTNGPAGVRITPLKSGVDLATLPASRGEPGREVLTALFGDRFRLQDSVLGISLNNHNAVYHVPVFLFNASRVERREDWVIWDNITPNVARYIKVLDDERVEMVARYGVRGIPVEDYVRQSIGVDGADLHALCAGAGAKRPNPTGPKSFDHRFITEDVPFGLVFFRSLGQLAGVPMPATDGLIALVSDLYRRDFAGEGCSPALLGLEGLSPERVVEVAERGF